MGVAVVTECRRRGGKIGEERVESLRRGAEKDLAGNFGLGSMLARRWEGDGLLRRGALIVRLAGLAIVEVCREGIRHCMRRIRDWLHWREALMG